MVDVVLPELADRGHMAHRRLDGGGPPLVFRVAGEVVEVFGRKVLGFRAARRGADRGPLAIALALGIVDRAVAHPPRTAAAGEGDPFVVHVPQSSSSLWASLSP